MTRKKEVFGVVVLALLLAGIWTLYRAERVRHNRQITTSYTLSEGLVEDLGGIVIKKCGHDAQCFIATTDQVIAQELADDGFTEQYRARVRVALLKYVNTMAG